MQKIIKKVLLLNKKEGQTPLECLESFRAKNKKYQNSKITYAGRLDPMARGLLFLLVDEEIKNKEKYLALEKEYEFEILFGFATDTYDILGKIVSCARQDLTQKELQKEIKNNLKSFVGKFKQKYPIYSSKTVKGKALFTYARIDKEVEIPERKIFIKKLKLEKITQINSKKLLANVEKRIKKVKGDFRQEDILKIWQENLSKTMREFFIGKFKIKCSSGAYVRSIANNLGEKLGVPALAFSIKRTKIGKWS